MFSRIHCQIKHHGAAYMGMPTDVVRRVVASTVEHRGWVGEIFVSNEIVFTIINVTVEKNTKVKSDFYGFYMNNI